MPAVRLFPRHPVPKSMAQIKFSTKSFGADASAVAARAIARVAETLTHADMADIIAGRPGGWPAGQPCTPQG